MFQWIYDVHPVALQLSQWQLDKASLALFALGCYVISNARFVPSFLQLMFYTMSFAVLVIFGMNALEMDLYWYGLAYLLAFLVCFWLLRKLIMVNIHELGNYLVLGVILGGKIGYMLLYDKSLSFMRGGMSFHGGLLGVAVACWLFSYVKKVNFWRLTDAISTVAPVGLFFGRIVNAINNEIPGKITKSWLGVYHAGAFRYPVSLYEALLEGLLLFVIMWCGYKRWSSTTGLSTNIFVMFYGVFRFIAEYAKDDVLLCLGYMELTYGQWLSILMFTVGLIFFWYNKKYEKSNLT